MKGLIRRLTIAALAVFISSLFPGPSVQARELLRERFARVRPEIPADNTVTGKDGARSGFSLKKEAKPFRDTPMGYMDLPVSFDNTSLRGAFSFDLQRKTGNAKRGRQTLFELLDAEGRQILVFQIEWKSEFDPRLPMVFIAGDDYWVNGSGLWSQQILFDREVAPGGWIHVDIAWDDAAKKYVFSVDGRAQDVTPKFRQVKSGKVLPDPRLDNAARLRWGKVPQPSSISKPFSYFLSRAAAFRIGVNSHPKKPHAAASFLSQSVLDDFVVLADAWPQGLAGVSRISSVSDDSFKVPGISGKLVAGDRVTVTLVAEPGGKASFDMGTVKGIPMAEVPANSGGPGIPAVDNGTYRGSYVIPPGDYYADGQVIGQYVSADNVAAESLTSASKWTIDARSRFALSIDKTDLPADSQSTARVRVKTSDANGNPLSGHQIKVTLSTTDEYTGLVGGGAARSRDAAQAAKDALDGAEVETRWKGTTDRWGEVDFDFRSGFAAKTIILQAKDMTSGDVGVDYITSYKEASIDIALTPPVNRAAARRGGGHVLKVEASRTELTADGRSRSVIRATLLDPNGKAVSGDPVTFSLSSENGTLRTIAGTTDSSGVATAEYIAGKKIGIVVVTAKATLRNATGTVSITLLSDAPAKVILKASPATLPADGNSRADIRVKVTDINDNPNKDTKVEFKLAKGSGKLEFADRTTDKYGDASDRFTAGTISGIASIVATVRSRVPTDAELANARNVLFVPYSDLGEEVKVRRWLKKVGETSLKGESIMEYTIGRNDTIHPLKSPYDCRVDFQCVEYWDTAQTGDTLALITPVTIPGSKNVPPELPVQASRRR
jgi:hypothetical protein